MSNYPPGVTGREFEIAGPDYERELDDPCPNCRGTECLLEQGYQGRRWTWCTKCDHQADLPNLEEIRYDADPRV